MAAAARRIRIRRTNRLKCLVCYLVCFALPVLWQFIGLWLIYPYKLAATAPNAAAALARLASYAGKRLRVSSAPRPHGVRFHAWST